MFSARAESAVGRYLLTRVLLCLLSFFPAVATSDSLTLDLPPLQDQQEAWLMTIAPGEIYWQRFGHNAIWLREPGLELDHTFNFGYFDFEQANFLKRFVTGRMLYQALAFDAQSELRAYAGEGRAIRAQRLNLSPEQYERLRDHLVWHVQPANRDYLYDYYLDNCSTRIRDAIDLALGGALSEATRQQPAAANFRDHTRRLTRVTFWYYLGLESVLGMPVDRAISRWDEMFLPEIVAETVASSEGMGQQGVLTKEEVLIFPGQVEQGAVTRSSTGWRYLVAALGLLLVLGVSLKAGSGAMPGLRNRLTRGLARSWLLFTAGLGVILLVLWIFTDHRVVAPNLNLLLLNPLFMFMLGRRFVRPLFWLVSASGVLALLQWPLLGWQYGVDVLALVLPLNMAASWVLYRVSTENRAMA